MSCLNCLSASFQHEGAAAPPGVPFISNSSWLLEPESDSLHHFPLRLQTSELLFLLCLLPLLHSLLILLLLALINTRTDNGWKVL